MAIKIKLRRDTAANWVEKNAVLDFGEPGYETDTGRMKIGNGVTSWNTLEYFVSGGGGGGVGYTGSQGNPGYTGSQGNPGYTGSQGGGTADLDIYKFDFNTFGTRDNPDTGGWGGYNMYFDPGGESNAFISIPSVANQADGGGLQIFNRGAANSVVQLFGQANIQMVTGAGITEKVFRFEDTGTLTVPYPTSDSFRITLGSDNFVSRPGKATLTLTGTAWDFYGAFVYSQDGQTQLAADNGPLPSIANPGYEDGDTFEIDSTAHGIQGYVLTVQLSNVVQAGPAGWTASLAFSEPPEYPSTVKSLGAIKLTANTNSFVFGTDGSITLPVGGDIVDSTGASVLGGAAGPVQPYLQLTNEPFITQPVILGTPVTVTAALEGAGAQAVVTITEGSVLDSITFFEPGTGYTVGQKYIIYSYQIGGPAALDSLTFTIGTVDENGGILTVTNVQFLGAPQNVAGVYVTGLTYQASVFDAIDTGLTLTRDLGQGIYNSALELEYDNSTYLSPLGTEWNSEGWGDLTELGTRTYTTWRQALNNQVGNNILASELVMHDIANDKYYKFDFTVWGGNNGSYAYTRTLVTDPNYFRKPHNADLGDVIKENSPEGTGIVIVRTSSAGIHNFSQEEGYGDANSPLGTTWNADGWDDLSNLTTRTYTSFYLATGQNINDVLGKKFVMYVASLQKYYAIEFLEWATNGNNNFAYVRYEIDQTKLNEGIAFPDGTKLKSALGVGRVKSTAPGNRRIEEVTGYNQVSVTARTTSADKPATVYGTAAENLNWYVEIVWDTALDAYAQGTTPYSLTVSTDGGNTWYPAYLGGYNGNVSQQIVVTGGALVLQAAADSVIAYRVITGADPVVWWDMNDLPSGPQFFRGAVIDYHAYTGESTIIGTIHIINDDGEEHISHQEVQSGSTDGDNDDLWLVTQEGQIKYRRIDSESKTLKIHWTAKVFYGQELYD